MSDKEGRITRSQSASSHSDSGQPKIDTPKVSGRKRKKSSSSTKKTPKVLSPQMAAITDQNGIHNGSGPNPISEEVTSQQWIVMFKNLNATLASLKTEITEIKGVKGKIETFSSDWKNRVAQQLSAQQEVIQEQTFRNNLLTNMVINQDEKMKELERKATASYQREIRPNLMIYGLLEEKDKTPESLVQEAKNFFKEQLEIEEEIEEEIEVIYAKRVGKGKVKPLLVRLKDTNDKGCIFANIDNLKGKTNARKKLFFIQDDMTEQQKEQRQWYHDLVKENKAKEDSDKKDIKMKKGAIIVNDCKIEPLVNPPTKATLLRMSKNELECVKATKVIRGPNHSEKFSEYHCHLFS